MAERVIERLMVTAVVVAVAFALLQSCAAVATDSHLPRELRAVEGYGHQCVLAWNGDSGLGSAGSAAISCRAGAYRGHWRDAELPAGAQEPQGPPGCWEGCP